MDPLKVLELTSTIMVIVAILLITIPKIEGFYLLIVAQIGWSIFAVVRNQNFFLIQSLFLLIFNFIGIYNWRRKKIGGYKK